MTVLDPAMGKLVVKRDDATTTTEGGIILPDDAVETPDMGTVKAVGPEYITEAGTRVPFEVMVEGVPHRVQPGDRVLFPQTAGFDFKLGLDEYVLMEHGDVCGALREVAGVEQTAVPEPEPATA